MSHKIERKMLKIELLKENINNLKFDKKSETF